ncbi:hypothetical protein CVV26_02905 [Candidatus Kuenenbacteria bacterium HGW-Kuenenbacteria-1]|uniref:Uncharacterized protein n=1 Tax=Candidatus Kuenenbacteria bacterium HGW-Kuenenbacteria-1 TaxID=2013812 RepID=A0A2N1UMV0_9BACT|nr:MAG: hypothetical protein CVV26_02905 [Candidatus Kuenenbacteria bacterium HGW-Kuenenbacteria-1]
MNKKILITIIILLALLIGGYFMKNFLIDLFRMGNKNVTLEWQSNSGPNPWETWRTGPKFEIAPTEKELMEKYYQNKFNPEKKIIDYKYKKHKGPIILDYKQIKIQNDEEHKQAYMENFKACYEEKRLGCPKWVYKVSGKRGLIIQITVDNKFKDGFLNKDDFLFLKERWKIVTEKNQQMQNKNTKKVDSNIRSNTEFNFENEQELADFLDSNYYVLDNRHKELANGKGINGWNKAIRKSDYCLLVVAVRIEAESNKTDPSKKRKGTITAKEKSIEDLDFWFDRSENTVREQLKEYNLDKTKVDEIINSMNKCKIKSNETMF